MLLSAMHQCDSINGASAHKVSLSLPLLEFSDATNGADDIRTGVSSARWWILFQYSSLISILFAALLAFLSLVSHSAFQVQFADVQSRLVLGHSWTDLHDVPKHVSTFVPSALHPWPRHISSLHVRLLDSHSIACLNQLRHIRRQCAAVHQLRLYFFPCVVCSRGHVDGSAQRLSLSDAAECCCPPPRLRLAPLCARCVVLFCHSPPFQLHFECVCWSNSRFSALSPSKCLVSSE